MKYQPTIDIWSLSDEERSNLQPGQWVKTGPDNDRMNKGIFLGVKPRSGSVVVAWYGNALGRGKNGFRDYVSQLRHYAKG